MEKEIDKTIPIFTEYFHALKSTEPTDIFNTDTDGFNLQPNPTYVPYDVVDELIKPLSTAASSILKKDGKKLLVRMEGALILPDATFTGKVPLVIIGHGNHYGYAGIDAKTHEKDPPGTRKYIITVPTNGFQKQSYLGYLKLQRVLAILGIASYSINLNIVNTFDNNEHDPFKKIALDASQRTLLFFHHLKLLKILAGEPVVEPAGAYALPLRFLKGGSFVDLKDELEGASPHPDLAELRNALANRIDYTRLGFMGHSRGADAVARVPAYFRTGTPLNDPGFTHHEEITKRIQSLFVQVGSPSPQHIKCILALQPTATKNDTEPAKHGYIIDNPQTMFFVVVGTHDEDVSFDAVRIYEYPTCPKAMIAINGACHKRFNKVWGETPDDDELVLADVLVQLVSLDNHQEILSDVFARCFTATLINQPVDYKFFTKEYEFRILINNKIDLQCAWKFGFPFGSPNVMNALDAKVTGITKSSLSDTDFKFEQDTNAFIEERENAGVFTIQIPLDPPSDSENLSQYTHFSFRFARGYELDDNGDRIEQKNFTVEFFAGSTLVGKTIEGKNIFNPKLKALRAFDGRPTQSGIKDFERSILLQTVEILLRNVASEAGLKTVTRIEIKIIPDTTKSPPRPASTVRWGSVAGGVVGSGLGVGGAYLYNNEQKEEDKKDWLYVVCGVLGAAAGVGALYKILKSGENAFAFTDFLLTNRQLP